MEKPTILKVLPAILGLAALGVPALGVEKFAAIWIFGFFSNSDGDGENTWTVFEPLPEEFENHPEMVLMPISGVIIGVGAVLALRAMLGVLKLGKLEWLPGVLMIAGVPLYFIGLAMMEIIAIAPVVINLACGALGGTWSIVNVMKAK